ncbi:MAG: hypothetical protein ACXWQQ_11850 [Pseudobdellovibrio sp.]
MNLGRRFFSLAITAQLLIGASLYSSSAQAAPRCSIRTLVEAAAEADVPASNASAGFSVSEIKGSDKIKLKAGTVTKLKKAFAKRGWELETNNIKEAIDFAGKKILGRAKNPSIERSDKMAEVGREILKAAKPDLTDAQYKMVNFMIAEAVMQLETFKIKEFKSGEPLPVFTKQSTLHIDKFLDLVESYVDGTSGYMDLATDGGFLSWPEIRGLYSNNSWAIGLRHHDMYHLHYSYGHPYYLAVNFHASRTINDRRYAMVSTLWEAVDTFRTGYENALAQYFRSRNMSVEEGMLYIGSATEKELDQIDQEAGSYTQLNSLTELSYASGWRPIKTKFGRGTLNYNETVFTKEIADYINEALRRMKLRGHQKYGNYHRLGPGNSVATDNNVIP